MGPRGPDRAALRLEWRDVAVETAAPQAIERSRGRRASALTKSIFSLGDHTVNIVLAAMTLVYVEFLVNTAELRPALAGLVPWIGRVVDALTDPIMGRVSDRTRWRIGRRRPYFLIGAVPFGVTFALLWTVPFEAQSAKFVYYTVVYASMSIFMTVVSVPYLALIPEMAIDYHERTSFNAYRSAAGVIAVFVSASIGALAAALGGGTGGWSLAGLSVGVWLVLPWFAVYAVSWERPPSPPLGASRAVGQSFFEAIRDLARHRAFTCLSGFYLVGRIAVDLVSVMFLFFFSDWIGRREDFLPTMFLFLAVVVLSLPFWLRAARRFDKNTLFVAGTSWWIAMQLVMFQATPDWPRFSLFLIAGLTAVGYAVADLMPWSMLPDVIDEDQLETGQRREGLYSGLFTFLRKLGGATAILCTGFVLDLAGYASGSDGQPESAQLAVRVLMTLVPAALLALAVGIALRYPLTREAHRDILERLLARNRAE